MPEEERTTLSHESWKVERHASIDEVLVNGEIRFHVKVWDEGREPFLTRWFNEEDRAASFVDKLKRNAEQTFEIRDVQKA